jgi:hypothetical protein
MEAPTDVVLAECGVRGLQWESHRAYILTRFLKHSIQCILLLAITHVVMFFAAVKYFVHLLKLNAKLK